MKEVDSCYKRFPKFIGTENGETEVQKIIVGENGEIAIAGQSIDYQLLNDGNHYFVGMIDSSGTDYLWMNQFPRPSDTLIN